MIKYNIKAKPLIWNYSNDIESEFFQKDESSILVITNWPNLNDL